jgi:hypothetical protein
MNFGCDMFRPINDGPFAEAFNFAWTSIGIDLCGIAPGKRIVGERVKNAEQSFPLSGGERSEHCQDGIIYRVAITHRHLPSEESLSCRWRSSSRECPPDFDVRSRRRLSSARQSGSSCVARQRTYSASSSRSSGCNSSTACLISARLMLEKLTIQRCANKAAVGQMKVVVPGQCGDTIGRILRDRTGRNCPRNKL